MEIDFSSSLVIISSSVGAIFIAAGLLLKYFPPEEINSMYGYRTKSSKKDLAHWQFSQGYSGKIMIILGFLYSLSGAAIAMFHITKTLGIYIGLGLMLVVAFLIFHLTEKAITTKFGE